MSENQILKINKRSFMIVIGVLLLTLVLAYILTFIWGDGYSIFKLVSAPIRVLGSKDGANVMGIGAFILILGGAFNVIDKTGGISAIIDFLVKKYQHRKKILIALITLFFMLFGALFGIFEESVTLLPMIIILSLTLGWDTYMGLGMCLLASGFGFSTALINPFSIGLGSKALEIHYLEGILFRGIVFVSMYALLLGYLLWYAKRIEKNPEKSYTYEIDLEKKKYLYKEELKAETSKKTLLAYGIFFILVLIGTILATIWISDLTMIVIAATFLIGSILNGILLKYGVKRTVKVFLDGLIAMSPALVMLILAGSVKFVIEDAQVMDRLISNISGLLANQNGFKAVLVIYAVVLGIQFFIGSASAKMLLIMPIIAKAIQGTGISKSIALLAFVFGDGYTDLIYPTNPVLLIALGMAGVSYLTWFKKTWVLQLVILIATIVWLFIAYQIGY